MIDSKILRGFSIEDAQSYGMPHIGAHYWKDNVNSYHRDDNTCCICGRKATNVHHHPQKGKATSFTLSTEYGIFVLKPALFALCGSGTTGCHGLIHNKKVSIQWKWDSKAYQELWFSGYLLSHGIIPHSPKLFEYGCWLIGDDKSKVEYRG